MLSKAESRKPVEQLGEALYKSADVRKRKYRRKEQPSLLYYKQVVKIPPNEYSSYPVEFSVSRSQKQDTEADVKAITTAIARYYHLNYWIQATQKNLLACIEKITCSESSKAALGRLGFVHEDIIELNKKLAEGAHEYTTVELALIAWMMEHSRTFQCDDALSEVAKKYLRSYESPLIMEQTFRLLHRYDIFKQLYDARMNDPDFILDRLITITDADGIKANPLKLKKYIWNILLAETKKSGAGLCQQTGVVFKLTDRNTQQLKRVVFNLNYAVIQRDCDEGKNYEQVRCEIKDSQRFSYGTFSRVYRSLGTVEPLGLIKPETKKKHKRLVKAHLKGKDSWEEAIARVKRETEISRLVGDQLRMKVPTFLPKPHNPCENSIVGYSVVRKIKGIELAHFLNECREGRRDLSEDQAKAILYGIIREYRRCIKNYRKKTSKNIVHRDLKPENIIIDPRKSGRIPATILDWNGAAESTNKAGTDQVCSPDYFAPERLKGHVTRASDIFSLGVVFNEVLSVVPSSPRQRIMKELALKMQSERVKHRPHYHKIWSELRNMNKSQAVVSDTLSKTTSSSMSLARA